MNEELLHAIMQLFALASTTDDITEDGKEVIKHSLRTEISEEQVNKFIQIYEGYLNKYHGTGTNQIKQISSTEIEKELESIKHSLNNFQKHIVVIRVLEYIFSDSSLSEYEKMFMDIFIRNFNISETDYKIAHDFTLANPTNLPECSEMIVVKSTNDLNLKTTRFVAHEGLNGTLVIIHVPSVNLFLFRYFGSSPLMLNRRPIVPKRAYIFTNGASIRANKMSPIFFSDIQGEYTQHSEAQQFEFNVLNVSYLFPSGDTGLNQFNINEKNGRLVAIMGGSGAGKSTMLNVLNGNHKPTTGEVSINGINIHTQKEQLKGVIGFVSQDDLLIEELTVFQNLFFSAKLSFDHLSDIEITEKVNKLLISLGLFSAKNLKVGSPIEKVISGGQRKRLNIALELIRQPDVLFVDEPTSGLSSRDSENIMDLMKELTQKGKLIFIVIHQPSSYIFKLFDRLILLDTGGYLVYYGEPVESVSYFKTAAMHIDAEISECIACGNVNSEIVFDILELREIDEKGLPTQKRKTEPKQWSELFLKLNPPKNNSNLKNVPHQETKKIEGNLQTPNLFKQFYIFLNRDILSKSTNKQYLLINLLEAPVLAMFIAFFVRYSKWDHDGQQDYIYYFNENIPAYIFMTVIVSLFIGMTVSAEEIFRDRKLQTREKFLNLNRGSYLWSKYVLLLAMSAIQSLLFVWVGNNILEINDMNFRYWLVMFSTSFFANMVGLNISASFNSAVTIYIIIPFLIIPQLIFSGVLVSFDRLNPFVGSRKHVPVIGEIMASRWAYEALIVTQFKDNPLEKHLYQADKKLSRIGYLKSYWLIEVITALQYVKHNYQKQENSEKVNRYANIIQQEISLHRPELEFHEFVFSSGFNTDNMDADRIEKIESYLDKLKRHLNHKYTLASKERDQKIYEIEKMNGDPGSFNGLKERYINKSVESMVRLDNRIEKVILVGNDLLQRGDPIFRPAQGFRAHFYSPNKKIGQTFFDTFWYNVSILWLMSLALMETLRFNVFKKLLGLFGKKRND